MSDDEVTREVDPNWLARLRGDESPVDHDNNGHAEDDEHTIGNADLLDQVRAAVSEARGERTPSAPTTPSAPPTPWEMSFPPPDPTSPAHSAKAAPTLTFPEARWQPPPRLKPITTAPAPALLADSPRPKRSRRALVLVIAAAVVAALIVGVLIGRSGSSDRTPSDDTVVTTADSTTASNAGSEVGP